MALETGTYISDLVSTNPVGTDTLDKADDHLRLIKSTVKATFPNITGPVTLTQAQLNAAARTDTANTFTANQIIEVTDNTNAALRVTQLGTGEALRVEDSSNPDSTPFVVTAAGDVGIGTSAPAGKLHAQITADGTALRLQQAGGTNIPILNINISETTNEVIFEETGSVAGTFQFKTAGSNRLQIDASGNILNISSGALGYGTGSGGTVTQATSKSTGVTLNKTNGQITTAADALAAGATASFTVTNSTVVSTDVIVAHSQNMNYSIRINQAASGSFIIQIKNESGGSLSQAVVINFAVIKAVTS